MSSKPNLQGMSLKSTPFRKGLTRSLPAAWRSVSSLTQSFDSPSFIDTKFAQKVCVAALLTGGIAVVVLWRIGILRTALFVKVCPCIIGAIASVLFVPKPRKFCPPFVLRCVIAFLICFAALAVIVFPWNPVTPCPRCSKYWHMYATAQMGPRGFEYDYGPVMEYSVNVITVTTLTAFSIMGVFSWRHSSSYAAQAVMAIVTVWVSSVVWFCQNYSMFCGNKAVTVFLTFLALTWDPVHWAATMVLFLRRTEQVIGKPTSRPCLIFAALLAAETENIVSLSPLTEDMTSKGIIDGSLNVIGDILLMIFALLCALPLCKILFDQCRLLKREAEDLHGVPKVEALWAAKLVQTEFWAVAFALGSTIVMRICMTCVLALKMVNPALRMSYTFFWVAIFAYRVYNIIHGASLLVLSGLLWKHKSMKKPQLPGRSDTNSAARLGADELIWNGKVRELANRGFELGKLLNFVEDLLKGHCMPSFDPLKSTTNDVVRQAVIPLSRGTGYAEGQALARIWNEGEDVMASRMITHNWGNLFLHLVSAIIVDAFGNTHYEAIAAQLASVDGVHRLRDELASQDLLSTTYWVCAFSVNQHASICAGFGTPPPPGTAQYEQWCAKASDSVTKVPFTACNCNTRKYFNNEPALTELNKFDDMMNLLAGEMHGFVHIIAVDQEFDVFMRAWCVAEMVEGGSLRVPQRVIIHSNESLDKHYMALASLDVRQCQASRAEDKDQILARIDDIAAFNEYLQWLLFDVDGLFGSFLDREARLTAVGSILQRLRLQRSNVGTESNAEDADSNVEIDDQSAADESEEFESARQMV